MSEDDPGFLFTWNDRNLRHFVLNANGAGVVNPRPNWIRTAGVLEVENIKDDIAFVLTLLGGGSFGNVFIGPNSVVQYGNIRDELTRMELDPWVQECMGQLPVGAQLATCAVVTDRSPATGTPANRMAPVGMKLVFA